MAKKYSPAMLAICLAIGALISGAKYMTEPTTAEAETAETVEPKLAPAKADTTTERTPKDRVGTATLRKERDGHYRASAQINGATVKILVDTGASIIALTPRDAKRAGLDLQRLPKTARISTANGQITARVAKLNRVRIGGVEVRNVDAVVVEEGLEESLLGMSFLNKLRSFSVTSTGLVLKQ